MVPMVFTWIATAGQRKSLPIYFGSINAQVSWGDGTTTTHTTPGAAPVYAVTGSGTAAVTGIGKTYATSGTYTVTITGYVQCWGFTSASQWADSRDFNIHFNNIYGIKVQSWGYIGLETLVGAHINLLYQVTGNRAVPSRLPPTVTDISYMFQHLTGAGQGEVVANWDRDYIANWDVSNVQNMSNTFYRCRGNFNTNLGGWNVGSVQNFSGMFYFAGNFYGNGLTGWNVSSATDMSYMFSFSAVNVDLPNWNVSNCQNFQRMFYFTGAGDVNGVPNPPFNGKLTYWNLSSAPNAAALEGMLYGSGEYRPTGFNGAQELVYKKDLTYWCVPNVPTRPQNFNTTYGSFNTISPTEPFWGTCPGNRPIVSSVTVDDTTTDEGQTITLTVNVSNLSNTTVYYR
jgi:hypothetical protein